MNTRQELQQAINDLHDAFRASIAKAIQAEPNTTYERIAERFGVGRSFVFEVARTVKIRRVADGAAETN